ncbi:MAG: UbiX family flavin prenyltransferase [Desulfurobacteriaceae bacterium]
MERVIVGITGASGSTYGKRCVEVLVANGIGVDLIFSRTGKKVFTFETGISPETFISSLPQDLVKLYRADDLFAPPSSGSYRASGMVIIPCSAGTLGHIANGTTSNLIHRAADVCLKEGRPLTIVFRETPINRIHAENILKLITAGATVLPASPAFYSHPQRIEDLVDFIVERALHSLLGRRFGLIKEWGGLPSQGDEN